MALTPEREAEIRARQAATGSIFHPDSAAVLAEIDRLRGALAEFEHPVAAGGLTYVEQKMEIDRLRAKIERQVGQHGHTLRHADRLERAIRDALEELRTSSGAGITAGILRAALDEGNDTKISPQD